MKIFGLVKCSKLFKDQSVREVQRVEMIVLLQEYTNFSIWSNEDMSSLDMDIVVHRVSFIDEYKTVK